MDLLTVAQCKSLAWRRPFRQIYDGDTLYLERFYVGQFGETTCYLHRFLSHDPDRGLHDHPWDSRSILLYGSYIEEILEENQQLHINNIAPLRHGTFLGTPDIKLRKVTGTNRISATKFHRIRELSTPEVWSLFYHVSRHKSWGFWREGRYHVFEEYAANRQPWTLTAPSKQQLFIEKRLTEQWGSI